MFWACILVSASLDLRQVSLIRIQVQINNQWINAKMSFRKLDNSCECVPLILPIEMFIGSQL